MPQTTFPSDSLELSMLVFHVHASIYRDVGPTLVAVEQVWAVETSLVLN